VDTELTKRTTRTVDGRQPLPQVVMKFSSSAPLVVAERGRIAVRRLVPSAPALD
jgi:hypothetical protein